MSIDVVSLARQFAIASHGDQKYSDKPYIVHLQHVHDVLERFGISSWEMRAAAYLHDVMEDCGVTIDDLYREGFPPVVVQLVHGVTDEPGQTRLERKKATYPKIAICPYRTTLKLADRIANVEAALVGVGKLDMYRREYPGFRGALYFPGDRPSTAMWSYLDRIMGWPSRENANQMSFPFRDLSVRIPIAKGFVELRSATLGQLRQCEKVLRARAKRARPNSMLGKVQREIELMEPYVQANRKLTVERVQEMIANGVPAPEARRDMSDAMKRYWDQKTPEERSAIAKRRIVARRKNRRKM